MCILTEKKDVKIRLLQAVEKARNHLKKYGISLSDLGDKDQDVLAKIIARKFIKAESLFYFVKKDFSLYQDILAEVIYRKFIKNESFLCKYLCQDILTLMISKYFFKVRCI